MSIDNEVLIGIVLWDEENLAGVSEITPKADPEPESEVIATFSKSDAHKH